MDAQCCVLTRARTPYPPSPPTTDFDILCVVLSIGGRANSARWPWHEPTHTRIGTGSELHPVAWTTALAQKSSPKSRFLFLASCDKMKLVERKVRRNAPRGPAARQVHLSQGRNTNTHPRTMNYVNRALMFTPKANANKHTFRSFLAPGPARSRAIYSPYLNYTKNYQIFKRWVAVFLCRENKADANVYARKAIVSCISNSAIENDSVLQKALFFSPFFFSFALSPEKSILSRQWFVLDSPLLPDSDLLDAVGDRRSPHGEFSRSVEVRALYDT